MPIGKTSEEQRPSIVPSRRVPPRRMGKGFQSTTARRPIGRAYGEAVVPTCTTSTFPVTMARWSSSAANRYRPQVAAALQRADTLDGIGATDSKVVPLHAEA